MTAPVIAELGWRCLNLGCPEREPVRAATAPTCYTCGRPMAIVRAPLTAAEVERLATKIEGAAPAGLVKPFTRPTTGHKFVGFGADPEREPERQLALKTPVTWGGHKFDAVVVDEFINFESEPVGSPRPVSRVWSFTQKPLSTNHVSIGRMGDPYCTVSIGQDVNVTPSWRCARAGCPERPAVYAAAAPICYTCAQPMTAAPTSQIMPVSGTADIIEQLQQRLVQAAAIPPATLMGGRILRGDDACERKWWYEVGRGQVPRERSGPLEEWRARHYGRAHIPDAYEVLLDGEPVTILDGRFVPGGDVWLLVPAGDWRFWRDRQDQRTLHRLEWGPGTARMVVEAARIVKTSVNGRWDVSPQFEIQFRRARPVERLQQQAIEDVVALGPDKAGPVLQRLAELTGTEPQKIS